MIEVLKATYHNGTFILESTCTLPEGIEVELFVNIPQVIPPSITDISTRQELLKLLVERMQHNPIPIDAPSFTRDMLYERR